MYSKKAVSEVSFSAYSSNSPEFPKISLHMNYKWSSIVFSVHSVYYDSTISLGACVLVTIRTVKT